MAVELLKQTQSLETVASFTGDETYNARNVHEAEIHRHHPATQRDGIYTSQ